MIYPTLKEVIISGEILVIWFPLRLLLGYLASEASKERKRIIKQHVHHGHVLPFKHCSDGDCILIASETQALEQGQEPAH
ncbi:hypothetical protein UFOVP253_24 [uncultured Caudovirales phage]|uniref:Uncharacterized protein n=1 Tax=uncultured Caudovirales phage TaxID=2100421 RepID=A0A6J5LD74_9CAUD|nr:hypothetical protein UFOVP253_24 [uncultured Caudovirales phage]